jgi:hypothetical protein
MLPDSHDGIESAEFYAIVKALLRRMIVGPNFVVPLDRTNDEIQAERHRPSQERTFKRTLHQRTVFPLRRQHHRKVTQADRRMKTGKHRIGMEPAHRFHETRQISFTVAANRSDSGIEDQIVVRNAPCFRFGKEQLCRFYRFVSRSARSRLAFGNQ